MKNKQAFQEFFRGLTTPSPKILNRRLRLNARFLSGILIVLVFFGTLSGLIQLLITPNFQETFVGIMLGVSVLTIALFISRTQYFVFSAVLAVGITSFVVILNYLANPMDTISLSYLIIGIFVASMFFSFKGTLLVVVLDLIALSFLPSVSEKLQYPDIIGYQLYLVIFSALMLISYLHRDRLEEERVSDLKNNYDATLEGWARALELIDKETEGHSRRVLEMTIKLATELGIRGQALEHIRRGALLHDIGKMGISENILLKSGPLTEDEWDLLRTHPKIAFDLLQPIPFLRAALEIPYSHHEKWDGTGYPQGLAGKEIPLAARIFAVVDVCDALSSDRPYRKAWPREKVITFIKENSGIHFDPACVTLFLANI